ncbi:hypothetical protein EV424DRAFT_1347110 [Suillus variegatus]|nr:hypothetical protein EV424DRAFT_1347110 [Suillus variegatus]
MALQYFPEVLTFYRTPDERTLTKEQIIPASLRDTSSFTRVLCFLALGRPDLEDHWESLQSKEGFEDVRKKLCSILSNTISVISTILTLNGFTVSFPAHRIVSLECNISVRTQTIARYFRYMIDTDMF